MSGGIEPLNAGRYVDLLCRAYRAIKAADPGMSVIAGALTPTGVNDGSTPSTTSPTYNRCMQRALRTVSTAWARIPSGYNNPPDAKFGYV